MPLTGTDPQAVSIGDSMSRQPNFNSTLDVSSDVLINVRAMSHKPKRCTSSSPLGDEATSCKARRRAEDLALNVGSMPSKPRGRVGDVLLDVGGTLWETHRRIQCWLAVCFSLVVLSALCLCSFVCRRDSVCVITACRGYLTGGHLARVIHYRELENFVVDRPTVDDVDKIGLVFKGVYSDIEVLQYPDSTFLHVKADITDILPFLTARACVNVAAKHGIKCDSKCTKSVVVDMAQDHTCAVCYMLTYVFEVKQTQKFTTQLSRMPAQEKQKLDKN